MRVFYRGWTRVNTDFLRELRQNILEIRGARLDFLVSINYMHRFIALLVAVTLAGCASADHREASSLQPYLPGIHEFLQGYVDVESTNELDFFFVTPVRKVNGKPYAYAYWMTGNSIIILDLPISKMDDYSWYEWNARIDLATDIVPTSDDINGSNYLVDAPWVTNIIRDSLKSGANFVIQRKEATNVRR